MLYAIPEILTTKVFKKFALLKNYIGINLVKFCFRGLAQMAHTHNHH